jgi:inositol transport system permease protein
MSVEDSSALGAGLKKVRRLPPEVSILGVLVGIALVFEILGWMFIGESFLANKLRLSIIILQVAVTGIIAIGVTQVIITAGVDLSSGSLVGFITMIVASLAQTSDNARAVYLQYGLVDMWPIWAVLAGLIVGCLAGFVNGFLIAKTGIPPFIATLGMMVSARGLAKWYTNGQPIALLQPSFNWIGQSDVVWGFPIPRPVIVFLVVAIIFHILLGYTRYGKFTYAIGANPLAARVSGINIGRHLIKVYMAAGMLTGLAAIITAARNGSAQPGMGVGYELDAIAATVIGGTSLAGGVGRISGTVIGTIILGIVMSGFTFLRVNPFYQEIVKGMIIVAAVIIDQQRQNKRRKA